MTAEQKQRLEQAQDAAKILQLCHGSPIVRSCFVAYYFEGASYEKSLTMAVLALAEANDRLLAANLEMVQRAPCPSIFVKSNLLSNLDIPSPVIVEVKK